MQIFYIISFPKALQRPGPDLSLSQWCFYSQGRYNKLVPFQLLTLEYQWSMADSRGNLNAWDSFRRLWSSSCQQRLIPPSHAPLEFQSTMQIKFICQMTTPIQHWNKSWWSRNVGIKHLMYKGRHASCYSGFILKSLFNNQHLWMSQ